MVQKRGNLRIGLIDLVGHVADLRLCERRELRFAEKENSVRKVHGASQHTLCPESGIFNSFNI